MLPGQIHTKKTVANSENDVNCCTLTGTVLGSPKIGNHGKAIRFTVTSARFGKTLSIRCLVWANENDNLFDVATTLKEGFVIFVGGYLSSESFPGLDGKYIAYTQLTVQQLRKLARRSYANKSPQDPLPDYDEGEDI